MDITDEQTKSKVSPTSSSQCVSSAPPDHVIPQMVITSADDTSEDQRNISECTLVLVPPGGGTFTDRNGFQNGSSNIQSDKPDVDFEDISVVVKDVISKCTDTVSHSISQRPLVIEAKSTQKQQQDDSSSKCPPPPPPLPPPPPASTPSPVPPPVAPVAPVATAHPSASQRPLCFESAVAKTEIAATVEPEISAVTEAAKIQDEELNFGLRLHKIEEPVHEISPEDEKLRGESSSPTKKESLHGVKKFFDSLWHPESQETTPDSGELIATEESGVLPETPKIDSSGIKKILRSKSQSPKVELPVDKNEPVLSSEALSEKEASSFAKDAKHSIKSFFDSFKHEPSEQTDSIKVIETQPEVISQSSPPQSPTEGKESTSFVKDTKQNIKTFFDSFKHESDGTQTKNQDTQVTTSKNVGEKILQVSPAESPKEGKESTSLVKDTKQNIKTFFDSFKHESDGTQAKSQGSQSGITVNDRYPQYSPPESPKERKESASLVKDTKQNIKTFFDSLKHESDGIQTKSQVTELDTSKDVSEKILQYSPPESPKEEKEPASFVKDTKQNIKTFFSFKHESSDQKKNAAACKKSASQPDFGQEPTSSDVSFHESSVPPRDKEIKDRREPKSFVKDTKQNIKSFFDTFKHDSSEQKHEMCESKISSPEPDFNSEPEGLTLKDLTLKKEPEISEETGKNVKDSSYFAKDTKQNIKSFFDTFKHEPNTQKQKDTTYKKSASQPDFSQDTRLGITVNDRYPQYSPPESSKEGKVLDSLAKDTKVSETPFQALSDISKEKESSVPKDSKQNRKSFFDAFKHDSSKNRDSTKKISDSESPVTSELSQDGETTKSTEAKETSSFAKDARQNIKTFFDTFKHDSAEKHKDVTHKKPALSEPDLSKDSFGNAQIQTKEGKHPLKKFFSFKHGGEDVEGITADSAVGTEMPSDREGKNKTGKVSKSVKLDLNIQYSLNGSEGGGKKFGSYTHMNGHEEEIITEVKERAQSVPSDIPPRSKGFVVLSQEPQSSEGTSPAVSSPDINADQQKEGRHSIKNFFDSFKHEKATKPISEKNISQSVLENEESKNAEKPVKDKKNKSIKRSLSDKVSREEVVQNFKGFFDSIGHKSSSKKSLKDSEHIYDTVEVRPEFSGSVPAIQVSEETNVPGSTRKETQGRKKLFSSFHSKESLTKSTSDPSQSGREKAESEKNIYQETNEPITPKSTKKESQGMKKLFSSFHSKESLSKSVPDSGPSDHKNVDTAIGENVNNTSEAQTSVDLPQPTVSESTAQKSDISGKTEEPAKADRTSMFNSIGENILALKDKVLHPKEKRKSQLFEDSVKNESLSPKVESLPAESSVKVSNDVPLQEEQKKDKEEVKVKPVPPEKPKVKQKAAPKAQIPEAVNKLKLSKGGATDSPVTLYDTCCMKIAVLLRDKALDIVSESTKSPPPKPPKPSAEAIARARAAAVSRRLDQKKAVSVGEGIPLGCDGMRFVDDETESSCDYKDLENFDYIMDYGFLNRYNMDSSKLDTFSVPSTCSGLTSFYTADNVTLRDEVFSDAGLETVSLSSDISYNLKSLSGTSKSEPKLISSASSKDLKKEIVPTSKESTILKQTTIKKVPPPIPPKPDISKLRTKSDTSKESQCVNGLSLSPRLQNKLAKDPAATQKRPLMVADIKGTQFSSLQHRKPKVVPKKPARSFDTVLKNESLKDISGVTTEPSKTSASASLPKQSSQAVTTSEDGTRTLTNSIDSSSVKIEKRTKSPPRPPPPVITKKPTPQRPPPPVKKPKVNVFQPSMEEKAKKLEEECDDLEKELSEVKNLADKTESTVTEKMIEKEQTSDTVDVPLVSDEKKADETLPSSLNDEKLPQNISLESSKFDIYKHTDELNNNIEINKAIADSLNNNVTISENPKPPPRNRRIRSRTVEVMPTERTDERMKRSQSLSEIDVQKRVTFLNAEKSEVDSKSLYSAVNKEGKRLSNDKTSQSSPDLVSGRPLPAPPPPPRRFRSLERKGKTKKDASEKKEGQTGSDLQAANSVAPSEDSIKPPRRRKTEKERFLSLHSDHRIETPEAIKRASSVPSKPDRWIKSEQYDVNANISSLEGNSSNPNIPQFDSTDSLNRTKFGSKSPSLPERKSSSSWYDASDLDEAWEMVDKSHSPDGFAEEGRQIPKVPARHRVGSKQKSRVTSKFYVNVEEETVTPSESPSVPSESPSVPAESPAVPELVDKETSPLPLDCSEKSVQTSLETLSQGIVSSRDVSHDVSHDDESEDTDELLDLAQTLQKELSTIINRHKSIRDDSEETPSPPLSAAASEKNLVEDLRDQKKISSVRSSTSEVWPLTSSDESDVEAAEETSRNLNEVAVKRKEKKIFYIAREIMTSEEVFVDALKLLNVDFKAAVEAASKHRNMSIIPDDALSQILNHLPQLQHLNENLLMELKDRIENWDKTGKIADIIVKMGPFLKLYSWYIHDFESNVSLLEDCKKKYPVFAQVVKEFEMSPRCKRLTLNHYMLKPIQRIPQYRLLLQEYLHHLTEDSKDYQDTVTALQIVSEVANHANDSMKQGDNAQKLISIQNSILGHKEIVKPGRVFVKEGELMKLSRKGMQPRWFVLFNDLLLYLTPVQQGLYRVNHELPLTGMKVAIPIQQDYQNEFSIISVTRSFTLAAKSQDERQEWIIALTKAIEENASKRSTFTNTRLSQRAQDKTSSEEEGAFVLGKKAPVWIPDARVTMCQLCTSEFTVTFRRHHCRACGKVICSICSSHRISLPYLGNRIARVCDECHTHLGQGSSACTESGETDSENQQIAVKSHLRTDKHMKNKKRALPSVLKEVCANDQGSTISGYLHKRSGKSWKRDWFVLKDKVLYEYKASEDVAALRSIPLLGYEIELFTEPCENIDHSLLFQLTHPGQAPIIFYADTVGSMERWVSALKTATVLE